MSVRRGGGRFARTGAALPFVLGALTVSLAAAAAAAAVVRGSGREARGAATVLQAAAAADGALAVVLADWPRRWNLALAPGAGAWRDVASPAGPARVRIVRLDAGRFALEAEGRSGAGVASDEGPAVRRRALLVRLEPVGSPSVAAVMAGGVVELAPGAVVDGADAVPAGWVECGVGVGSGGAGVAVAASAVHAEPGATVAGAVQGDSAAWKGALAPRFGGVAYGALAAVVQAGAGAYAPAPRASGVAGGDAGAEPCAVDAGSWGEPRRGIGAVAECGGAFPVVRLGGALVRLQGPARFQGTLLVDGDLEVDGLVEGAGAIVVRGAVRAAGALVLDGALVAGGGVRLGAGSRVRASGCATSRAAAYAARASPLARRAWAEVQR